MFGFYPTFSAISNTNASPSIYCLVGNIHPGSFMQDKQVSTLFGRCLLDIYRWFHNDGTRPVYLNLFLLIGKQITYQEGNQEEQASEKSYLTHEELRSKEINQYEYQRHDDTEDSNLSPIVYTRVVDKHPVPCDEEHL